MGFESVFIAFYKFSVTERMVKKMVEEWDMFSVEKEELKGFRKPTNEEIRIIKPLLLNKLSYEKHVLETNMILFIIGTIGMARFIVFHENWESVSIRFLICIAITVVSFIGAVIAKIRLNKNKIHTRKAMKGHFLVLDCFAYKWDKDKYNSALGTVCIAASGQYCKDKFHVAEETIESYEKGKKAPLLLVKCATDNGKCNYYKLASLTAPKIMI